MNEITGLNRSRNPNVISNTPSGKPTAKADARADFVAECINAIEAGDVEKMKVLFGMCGEYPIMKAKPERALS